MIIWTNDDLLSIEPLRTNFIEMSIYFSTIFIPENEFENFVTKMAAILFWPQGVKQEMSWTSGK